MTEQISLVHWSMPAIRQATIIRLECCRDKVVLCGLCLGPPVFVTGADDQTCHGCLHGSILKSRILMTAEKSITRTPDCLSSNLHIFEGIGHLSPQSRQHTYARPNSF